jgi:hypothetical protein
VSRYRGFDGGVLDAFIIVPPVVALAWLLLLSGRFVVPAMVVVWVLMAFATRPVIWLWAAQRPGVPEGRAEAYRERQRYTTNTSFVAAALVGLAALDVVPLPGAPYWTDQPRASFALAVVAVYLLWLAMGADIPREVAEGWRGLFGKGRERDDA